jgi:hypothetical protein
MPCFSASSPTVSNGRGVVRFMIADCGFIIKPGTWNVVHLIAECGFIIKTRHLGTWALSSQHRLKRVSATRRETGSVDRMKIRLWIRVVIRFIRVPFAVH